jgi:hypothetical protein
VTAHLLDGLGQRAILRAFFQNEVVCCRYRKQETSAFLSMGLFLAINGYHLKPDQVDAIQIMLAVAGWGTG